MKLPTLLQNELDASGRPYSVEPGRGHLKVKIEGRLVGVLGANARDSEPNRRAALNVRAQIRRALRSLS